MTSTKIDPDEAPKGTKAVAWDGECEGCWFLGDTGCEDPLGQCHQGMREDKCEVKFIGVKPDESKD